MNRSLLTSAALAALITAPALAQQTGTNPNAPGTLPSTQQPGVTQGTQPNTNPQMGTRSGASMTGMTAEITAEDIQGMTVYTTRIDVATGAGTTGSTANNNATRGTTGSTSATGSGLGSAGSAGTGTGTGTAGMSGSAGTSGMPGSNMTGTSGSVGGTNLGTATIPSTADNRPMTKDELKQLTDRARSIGEVNDILIGPDGRVVHAIVDVGGFLGVGERPVAVSWQDLKIVRTNDGDMVAFIEKSRAELDQMPQYRAPAKR